MYYDHALVYAETPDGRSVISETVHFVPGRVEKTSTGLVLRYPPKIHVSFRNRPPNQYGSRLFKAFTGIMASRERVAA